MQAMEHLLSVANIFWLFFFWICDYNAIKERLEYDGCIHQLKRWSQELLAYKCVCIHHPNSICHYIDPSFIAILLTPLLCVPRTFCYDPLFVTLMCFHDVLTYFIFHNMMFPQLQKLYPLFPLLWYFIIIQFGSLPTCNPYLPSHLFIPFGNCNSTK